MLKINSSTNSSSISQDENKIDIQKSNFESPIKNYIIKFKHMNYIPKNSNNFYFIFNEDKEKKPKMYSPIYNYYKEIENNYIKTKSVDLSNSINFVHKNIISSSKFNFNNDKFIIKNNKNNLENKNHLNLDNNNNNQLININNNNHNEFYSNKLNKNIVFNNTYLKNTPKNYDNKFDISPNSSFDNNNISFEEKNAKEKSEEKHNNVNEKFNYNHTLSSFNIDNNPNNLYDNFYNNYYYDDITNSNIYINDDIDRTIDNNNKDNQIDQIDQIDKIEPINWPNKKNRFHPRPYDWVCYKCFNLNFAFRIYCNRCSEPKDSSISNYYYF